MATSQKDSFCEVVDLLVKDYRSKFKKDFDQKIGKIDQDFIDRGLFNTTARVSHLLHTEFEYIQELLNYVIKSIEKDYSHFQLASCKSRLLKISEEEYKKLISKTTARLVESNLGQEGIFKIYEKGILDEMEKSKERIEIQCALLEKERVARKDTTEKWYQNRTIQAALITGGFTLIAAILTAILTSPLWIPFITKAFDSSGKNVNIPDSREITEIPSSTPVSENPDAGVINDFNSIASQELETKPPPMIKESKTSIEPEEREGNVNRSAQSSFLKIRETSITPEDTAAEVNKPPVKPFIKRDDGPIEPEKIQGKVEKRE